MEEDFSTDENEEEKLDNNSKNTPGITPGGDIFEEKKEKIKTEKEIDIEFIKKFENEKRIMFDKKLFLSDLNAQILKMLSLDKFTLKGDELIAFEKQYLELQNYYDKKCGKGAYDKFCQNIWTKNKNKIKKKFKDKVLSVKNDNTLKYMSKSQDVDILKSDSKQTKVTLKMDLSYPKEMKNKDKFYSEFKKEFGKTMNINPDLIKIESAEQNCIILVFVIAVGVVIAAAIAHAVLTQPQVPARLKPTQVNNKLHDYATNNVELRVWYNNRWYQCIVRQKYETGDDRTSWIQIQYINGNFWFSDYETIYFNQRRLQV